MARLSFRFNSKIRSFTDKQKLRVQYYQISFTKNAKGTSVNKQTKKDYT